MHSPFLFGWAKPVPITPQNFKKPRTGWPGCGGGAGANLLMAPSGWHPAAATFGGVFLKFLRRDGTGLAQPNRNGLCMIRSKPGISRVCRWGRCGLMGLKRQTAQHAGRRVAELVGHPAMGHLCTVMAKRRGIP